jgi:hypothetical protein
VFAAEHFLDLAIFDEAGELLDARRQFAPNVFALSGPVDKHTQIVRFRLQGRNQLDFFFDAPAALENFLRLDLVVPEIGRGGAGFYLCELVTRASGFKDSSGGRPSV